VTVLDANQNLLAGETYFGGRYLGTQTPTSFNWVHADELGTVRARTNAAAALTESDLSGPRGEPTNLQNGTSQIHFTGQIFDPETNLTYFGARYYQASSGRFLTPDWSEAPEPVPYACSKTRSPSISTATSSTTPSPASIATAMSAPTTPATSPPGPPWTRA